MCNQIHRHTDYLNTPRLIRDQNANTVWRNDNTELFRRFGAERMRGPMMKRWLLFGLGVVACAVFFAAGCYVSLESSRTEIGERALGGFMQGLSALSYLDKENIDGARHSLRVMLDGDLLTMSRYGTPLFDAYSGEKNPGAKQRLLLQYDDIRKKYPPIEYSDGGAMNRDVDAVLNSARNSLGNQGKDSKGSITK